MIKSRSILIVDPDLLFLQSLVQDPSASSIPPLTARTGKEAQLLIGDSSHLIAGVFVNPSVKSIDGGPDAASVIRFSQQHRSTTPIFGIYDESQHFQKDAQNFFQAHGVPQSFQKPLTYSTLMKTALPELILQESVVSEYIPIRAANFVSGSQVSFDVFIRLETGRHVNLIQKGDAFDPERLNKYLEKGVQFFYLKREQHEHYLKYCNEISKAVLKSEKISTTTKLSQIFNSGEETLKFLKGQGLSENRLQYASRFVMNVHTLVESLNLMSEAAFDKLTDDLAGYEHAVATSIIAALMADQMKIHTDSVAQIVGLSALMHDIGLCQLPVELHDEDESAMTEEQKELFYSHPDRGAEILRQFRGIHPSVIQAVRFHHERKGKKGFSLLGPLKQPNTVAEIIGISSDYVNLLARQKKPRFNFAVPGDAPALAPKEPLEEMMMLHFDGFSAPVVAAFQAVFMSNGR